MGRPTLRTQCIQLSRAVVKSLSRGEPHLKFDNLPLLLCSRRNECLSVPKGRIHCLMRQVEQEVAWIRDERDLLR